MSIYGSSPGLKQRDRIKMTPEEVAAYLVEQKNVTMSTIAPDGTIHSVAMWYAVLDGEIVFETKAKSQKVKNLRRDPRITCLVDSGETYKTLRGVELVGRGEIVEDPDELWRIGVAVFEKNTGPYTDDKAHLIEKLLHKRVGVKVHVDKTVSWDHSKLI